MLEIKGATGSTNKGPYEYQQDFNDLTNLNAKNQEGRDQWQCDGIGRKSRENETWLHKASRDFLSLHKQYSVELPVHASAGSLHQ